MRLELFGGPHDGHKLEVPDKIAFHGYIGFFMGGTYAILQEEDKEYPRLCFVKEGRPDANRNDASPTQSSP